MPENVNAKQIKAILKKNGISSMNELAKQLADSQNSKPGTISKEGKIGELAASWVIKVWKLDSKINDLKIKELPKELGGDLMKH